MKKKERKRVGGEQVRSNAAEAAGGGLPWLKLPKGVDSYRPERAGVVKLDILPYEVKSGHHPDRVEPGTLWYKYPFSVHYSVGVNKEQVLCPGSMGKKCPICEERARLAKNWDENEEMARALTPQKWVAYNAKNPDEPESMCVFVFSRGKFAEFLESELQEGDDANLCFYDVTDEGRTLKVRFSEDQYDSRKFLKATRIDFIPREAMDEDEILKQVVCLDEIFIVHDYDKLAKLFAGREDEDEPVKKMKPVVDEDDDDDDDDEEAKDLPKPIPPKKQTLAASVKKMKPVVDEDDDDDDDEPVKKPVKKMKPVVDEDDDDDDDDED